jgi:hypothetical protein
MLYDFKRAFLLIVSDLLPVFWRATKSISVGVGLIESCYMAVLASEIDFMDSSI